MVLSFATSAKKLKKAWETNNYQILVEAYDKDTAECIEDALNVLNAARNLHDLLQFKYLRPHPIDNNSIFSLSLHGRKRITLKTLDKNRKPTKHLDYSSEYGIILEVTEHYGE